MRLRISSCARAVLASVVIFWVIPLWGQSIQPDTKSESEKIDVSADSLSISGGGTQIEAKGNVQIKRQQMTLKADEVRVNRETQDLEAKGRISVDDPEWKVKSADSMEFNLGKETGEIRNGDLFIEQGHVSIFGQRFQKLGGQSYHIDEGFFTTCMCESGPAPWRISASEIDLNLEGTGIIKDGYFYIYDVPVLYLPYGFFPLRSERQTGFLFPKFGQSSEDGFRFLQPFYWAISKSTDATLSFDIETSSRVGLLGEFRTKFDRDSDLQLLGSYFNEVWRKNPQDDIVDRTIADQDIPKNRWSVVGTHRYRTAGNWLTYSDIAAYGDDLFTRELVDRYDLSAARERDIRVSRYGRSQFGAFRNWRDTFVKGQWDFYQDFIQPDDTTLQRTPQLAFWGRRLFRGFPLEFRWWAEGVNYLRRKDCPGDGSTDNCGDGFRLDLRPEVVLPFRMASYLFGALSVAPRETVYHLYSPVKSSDRNISRELVEIRGNIGTYLSRVFSWGAPGTGAIRHVIEPELSYLFVPSVDQSRIPLMDGVDRVRRRNILTLAAANRLWRRFGSVSPSAAADGEVESLNPFVSNIQEMGSLRLALSYDIDKERKGGDSLSDLDINLRLLPTGYLVFDFDGGVNPGGWNITQGRATLTLVDPRPITRRALDPDFMRPNSFSIGYHYLINGPNGFLAEDANIDLDAPPNCARNPDDPRCPGAPNPKNVVGNLVGHVFYHVTDNILLSGSSVYDVRDSRFIGFRAATKLLSSCDCWTMTFSVSQSINPSKTSFSFDFNLLGLGSQKKSTL